MCRAPAPQSGTTLVSWKVTGSHAGCFSSLSPRVPVRAGLGLGTSQYLQHVNSSKFFKATIAFSGQHLPQTSLCNIAGNLCPIQGYGSQSPGLGTGLGFHPPGCWGSVFLTPPLLGVQGGSMRGRGLECGWRRAEEVDSRELRSSLPASSGATSLSLALGGGGFCLE